MFIRRSRTFTGRSVFSSRTVWALSMWTASDRCSSCRAIRPPTRSGWDRYRHPTSSGPSTPSTKCTTSMRYFPTALPLILSLSLISIHGLFVFCILLLYLPTLQLYYLIYCFKYFLCSNLETSIHFILFVLSSLILQPSQLVLTQLLVIMFVPLC